MGASTNRLYLLSVAGAFGLGLLSVSISHILVRSHTAVLPTPMMDLESFVFSSSGVGGIRKSASSSSKVVVVKTVEDEEALRREVQELKERLAVLDRKLQVIGTHKAEAPSHKAEAPSHKAEAPSHKAEAPAVKTSNGGTAKYAYAFVIGGCRPERPKHRGYIYNILVVRQLLREFGSKADMVALIQMSSKSNATELDDVDVKPLKAMGVQIKYVPKDKVDSFYGTVMRKFDILDLTQYRRVILLDGDVMPMGNLDYLFELSEGPNPLLKPNFVINGPWEPSNAGFFMVEPGEGYLDEVRQIIKRREESSPERGFDRYIGWGHPIQPPDEWVARQKRGTNWTFLFAESDQGLLYYYTKYHRKSVSLIQYLDRVENWGTDANGNLVKEGRTLQTFKNYSKPFITDWKACIKFLCDIKHFTGGSKPWHRMPAPTSDKTKFKGPHTLWWYTLKAVNTQIGMGLDFTNWTVMKGQPLGYFAGKKQTILNFKK